ncbi:MAG TPA: hypothetical protein DEG69_15450 [Flavobacteriaceae bacterium]|nr:hypothetical protein [Flavobacteriaceae bacterium]
MSKEHVSAISTNISNGTYVRNSKFANFGSVVEDSIMAQQREYALRLKAIQAERERKKNK